MCSRSTVHARVTHTHRSVTKPRLLDRLDEETSIEKNIQAVAGESTRSDKFINYSFAFTDRIKRRESSSPVVVRANRVDFSFRTGRCIIPSPAKPKIRTNASIDVYARILTLYQLHHVRMRGLHYVHPIDLKKQKQSLFTSFFFLPLFLVLSLSRSLTRYSLFLFSLEHVERARAIIRAFSHAISSI